MLLCSEAWFIYPFLEFQCVWWAVNEEEDLCEVYQQIQKAVLYTQGIYSPDVLYQWDFSVVTRAAVRCQQDIEHSLC